MIVLIALVLSVITATAEARHSPKLRVFEIVLDSESEAEAPSMSEAQDLPSFRTDTNKLAMQLVTEIDMLLGTQNQSDSESQEHSVFDETRSSLVLVPPDSEHVYRITRDKKPEVMKKFGRLPTESTDWVPQSVTEDDSKEYGVRGRSGQQYLLA